MKKTIIRIRASLNFKNVNFPGFQADYRVPEWLQKLRTLQKHDGRLPFSGLDGTSAKRNAILQARNLALSPDHNEIVDVSDMNKRLKLFCEILENLRVATTPNGPKLYKPAMLACVMEAIQDGQLPKNEITFDFIVPRFIKKLDHLGEKVTEVNAAQPFYHLTGDLLWFHAVNDINDPMKDGKEGPAAARRKVKYALLKDTFWDLLQDPAARKEAMSTLERKWFNRTPTSQTSMTPLNFRFLQDASAAIAKTGLIYDDDLLRRFVASLLTKPFVLLTGTSGTGKTQLALKFAQWLCGEEGYELVPVGADWTDNRQVLGHYNPFECKFNSTRILDLILRANDEPGSPFFLILDEMNLSHVERYFADFLSAMESGESISLHRNGTDINTAIGTTVPEEVKIPRNLFVIGTVNIDETTYMFSPKVLDRANVIEFSITLQDLGKYMDTSGAKISKPEPASKGQGKAVVVFENRQGSQETLEDAIGKENLKTTRNTITDLFSILDGTSLEFGFRTSTEFLRYCEIDHDLSEEGNWNCELTCDIQILQKILPKLHGSRRRIEALLVGLASYCTDRNLEQAKKYTSGNSLPSNFILDQAKPKFPKSFVKLRKMIEVIRRDQFVSFIQ